MGRSPLKSESVPTDTGAPGSGVASSPSSSFPTALSEQTETFCLQPSNLQAVFLCPQHSLQHGTPEQALLFRHELQISLDLGFSLLPTQSSWRWPKEGKEQSQVGSCRQQNHRGLPSSPIVEGRERAELLKPQIHLGGPGVPAGSAVPQAHSCSPPWPAEPLRAPSSLQAQQEVSEGAGDRRGAHQP